MPMMERGKDLEIEEIFRRILAGTASAIDLRHLGRFLAGRRLQEVPEDFGFSSAEIVKGIVQLRCPELAERLIFVDRGESIMIAPQPIIDDEAADHQFECAGDSSRRAEIPSIAPADQPEKAAVA